MNRRDYLTAVIATGTPALAGCAGSIVQTASQQRTIGETVTYKGLRATVSEFTTTERLDGETANTNYRAGEATTLLLVRGKAKNTGDVRRRSPFPAYNTVFVQYRDQARDPLYGNGTWTGTGGDTYKTWHVNGQEEDGYLYPGSSVSGWVGFEIEDTVAPEEVTVVFGMASGEKYKEFTWSLE